MGQSQFPPISDKVRFPLLSSGTGLPADDLMGCEDLTCFTPEKLSEVRPVICHQGKDWHLYGDTMWPSLSSWIEFDTGPVFSGWSGVLVVAYEIPDDVEDPFEWVARNNPLCHLFPHERSEAAVTQRAQALRQQAESDEELPEPEDTEPCYVQCYCIYRGPGTVEPTAKYMDLLNIDGIPLTRYRTAEIAPHNIDVCRYTLHALFSLNQARLNGMNFLECPQLDECVPLRHAENDKIPSWERFHPLRVMRTRPAVRAIPTPTNLHQGIMQMETAERIMEARRLEITLHTLPFVLDARPRTVLTNDGDACMGAFAHRANGGAIFVLPDSLVEEFDNTDCSEVQLKDIKLPFPNIFIKFTPPEPLFLAEGATVDGCYIVKQGEEYLFSLTSRWEGVDYEKTLSIACLDPTFSIHLPAPELKLNQPGEKTDICINEAVELGIKGFLELNAPPTEDLSQTITRPDGTTAHMEDVRAKSRKRRIEVFRSQEPIFRACLNIIVNAACFISFRPEDITEEWDGDAPTWLEEALKDTADTRRARDRRQHAQRIIAAGDFTRIRICGKNLFQETTDSAAIGYGKSPKAHWRRGHWRRQRYGTGLSLIILRWIRPTIVKKDSGPLAESRIYDVQDPQVPPTP
jgi:hypothetical protein